MAGGRELPNVELEIAYRTVSGREQGRPGEVKTSLLERGQRFADLRIVSALGAERLTRLLERGLRVLELRLGGIQLRLCLIAPRDRVDAQAHQLRDARRLLPDVVPVRDLFHHFRLRRIHRRSGSADGLPGRCQLGFGTLDGYAEGDRIYPVQEIAGADDLVVTRRDLNDLARDLRYSAHDEGTHAGVAGVRRQAVGDHRPAEQQDAEGKRGQRPTPQRIGGPGARRRRSDLLGRSLQIVHAGILTALDALSASDWPRGLEDGASEMPEH